VKGHEDAEETGASFLGRKAERAETVQPTEEQAEGRISLTYVNTRSEGAKKMESGCSQWCAVTGPEAMGTN